MKIYVYVFICMNLLEEDTIFLLILVFADMLDELQEHVESFDMANGEFILCIVCF